MAQRRLRERLAAELDTAELEEIRQTQPDADLANIDENARSTLTSREAEIVRALRGGRLVVVPIGSGRPADLVQRWRCRPASLVRPPPGR